MAARWLLLVCCLGAAVAEAPVTYPGPDVSYGPTQEVQSSYGPPQSSYGPPQSSYGPPQPEKAFPQTGLAAEDSGFGFETGYQGLLVPALEAATAAVTGSSPNPLAGPNPFANLLGASTDLLANSDLAASYPALFGSTSILSKPWFWGLAPKLAGTLLKSLGTWLVKFAFVVFLGGGFTVAVCTFTPICTLSFLGFGLTRRSLTDSMRSYITQDRLSQLTAFVNDAIEKYRHLQLKSFRNKSAVVKKDKPLKKASEEVAEARTSEVAVAAAAAPAADLAPNVHNSPRNNDDLLDTPPEQVL